MSLKLKISLFSIIAILALSAMLLWVSLLIQDLIEKRYEAGAYNRDSVVLRQVVDQQVSALTIAVPNFTRNSDLIKSVKKRQYDKSNELLKYSGNRLSVEGVLEKLALFDLQGEMIATYPEEFSFKANDLLSNVRASNEPAYSVEIDSDDKAKIHYAFPIFYRGKPVGYVALIQGLDDVVASIKKYLTADVFIFTSESDKASYTTSESSFWGREVFGVTEETKNSLERVEHEEKIYEATVSTIQNFNNNPIAHLVILKDYTENFSQEKGYKNNSLLGIGAAIIIFIVILLLFLRLAFKPLTKFADDMYSLAEGDLDIDINTSKKDETAPMAKAMEVFKQNAIERIKLEEKQKEQESRAEEEQKRIIREQEERITEEISGVIKACSEGDFTQRLDTEGKEGLLLTLSESMNKIGEVSLSGMMDIKEVLNALSTGDLTTKMSGEYDGIFHEIRESINSTVNNLNDMVNKIKVSSETVNTAAQEITSGSSDLAHRTEEQASSLEETAAATEEITVTVKQNTENAKTARELVKESSDVAAKGGKIVKDAVLAMQNIQDASKQISDIIGTIDEIAFQTNLLSLNASVEAARAGESGKGFAVVAAEVRSLAGRSSEASKEIKGLISNSVQQVGEGVKLVNHSGDSLEEIIDSVSKLYDLVSIIADASEEQYLGVESINSAILNIDKATKQNAALVEENTDSAESMSQQGGQLLQLVSFFRTYMDETEVVDEAPVVEIFENDNNNKVQKKVANTENLQLANDEWEEF